MKSVVNLLSSHVAPVPRVTPPSGTYCAFEGVPLDGSGVLLKSVVKPATANIADTFKYPSAYVLPSVGACFKAQRELRGNLYVTEAAITRPFFSVTSAAETGRPSWLSALTAVLSNPQEAGTYCFILTDEAKRRLWPAAVTTQVRETFDIYWNVGSVSRVVRLRSFLFGELLKIVTSLLTAGVTRMAIEKTLLLAKDVDIDMLPNLLAIDKVLSALRGSMEFQVAVYVGRDLRELSDDADYQNLLLPNLPAILQCLNTLTLPVSANTIERS